jgi:hypothetical protein
VKNITSGSKKTKSNKGNNVEEAMIVIIQRGEQSQKKKKGIKRPFI